MKEEIKKEKGSETAEDLTGRTRMAKNILFSWGSYLVVVVAGFIMPRLIDHHVGQTLLGIWDFCWALVSYFELAGLGLGSSVNRFVATYRSKNDIENLRQSVSSVACIQILIAALVAGATLLLVWLLPIYFSKSIGNDMETARFVVGILGFSVALQFAFDIGRGIMTGCHRWDLHGLINGGARAVSLVFMVLVLINGGGLVGLAIAHIATVLGTEVFRIILAHRICPELKIRVQFFRMHHAKTMLTFGGKSVISGLSNLMLFQTTNVLLVSALGPAALAVFARPIALVTHAKNFVNKFAFVLTPTVGSLQGLGKLDELNKLFITSAKFGMAFTAPMLIVFMVFGDVLLELWMGPDYADWLLIFILALGHLLPVGQSSVMRVLVGMDLHGKIGILNLIFTFVLMIIGLAIIYDAGWSLINAALLIVVPLTIVNGLYVPIYGCRRLGISYFSYVRQVFIFPLICGALFAGCLFIIKMWFHNKLLALPIGLFVGGIGISWLYWKYLLEEGHREILRKKLKIK